MTKSVQQFVFVCGVLLAGFLVLIGWAWIEKGVFDGFKNVMVERWGWVAMADLVLGFLFVAAWMCVVEPNRRALPVWILALFLLGNMVTLVYVLRRARSARTVRDIFLPATARPLPAPPT
jgi:hypothetical protein